MLAAPLTIVSIRCPSVVYVNSPSHSFGGYIMVKTVREAVNINYWWMPYV
jgi:hypothetical protein